MPELPEVETIVRKLGRGEPVERGLPAYPPPLGHSITRVWTDWPRAAYPSANPSAGAANTSCSLWDKMARGAYPTFSFI